MNLKLYVSILNYVICDFLYNFNLMILIERIGNKKHRSTYFKRLDRSWKKANGQE